MDYSCFCLFWYSFFWLFFLRPLHECAKGLKKVVKNKI
ncbi:hypothetical protein BREVNS_1050 [Brevinematales bacterium NS]|nr:hypothetical protein BREVNS_1050 [Brevinematales bacterium NS]